MLELSNANIAVEILDPHTDQERFGVRYCTGGSIFQVTDQQQGHLLTGPTYPHSFNWFDGQGIPDAFNLRPLQLPGTTSQEALIIGIGLCDLHQKHILELCHWNIDSTPSAITMHTTQQHGSYALDLERSVRLHERSILSHTRLKNTGAAFIPVCWFPHPFFPHPKTDELCRINIPFSIPEQAEHYSISASGFLSRKDWDWDDIKGHYQALDHVAQTNLVVIQRHPILGMLSATCSYVPSFLPVWGNPFTFSWEPFLEHIVASGQTLEWSISYDF